MPIQSTAPGIKPGATYRVITYAYFHAFTSCDCGEPLTLAQKTFKPKTYSGQCQNCKKSWALQQGKLYEETTSPQPPPKGEPASEL